MIYTKYVLRISILYGAEVMFRFSENFFFESDLINKGICYLVIISNKEHLLAPLAILGVRYDTCKVSNTLTNDKFPTIHSASAM